MVRCYVTVKLDYSWNFDVNPIYNPRKFVLTYARSAQFDLIDKLASLHFPVPRRLLFDFHYYSRPSIFLVIFLFHFSFSSSRFSRFVEPFSVLFRRLRDFSSPSLSSTLSLLPAAPPFHPVLAAYSLLSHVGAECAHSRSYLPRFPSSSQALHRKMERR